MEGRQRRSERISAFDTWKLAELTRASGAPRGRRVRRPSSLSSSSAPLAPVRGRKRGRKKRRLKAVVEVVDCLPSSSRPAGSESNDDEDGGSDEDDRFRCQEQKHGCRKEEVKHIEKEAQNLNEDDDLGGTVTERQAKCSSMPWIPDKKTLELILDILQKKDTHEIFAEPVDPEEVEGYYEIVKEPMDFATMRGKLQEGMYETLEQFERDAFLIFSNAMYFNSTSTIYYKQARVIQELAKKTFHRLKTDPENFVLDHVTRTKFGDNLKKASTVAGNTKGQGESRSSDGSASTNKRQRNFVPAIPNEKPGLSSGRSHHRTFAVYGSSPLAVCKKNQDEGVLGCLKDGWRSFSEEERRSTYKSSNPSSCKSDQMLSSLCGGLRELVYVNQGDFGYVESLAHFAANLGPTARMVAQRKIGRCKLVEAANALSSFSAATGAQVSVCNNTKTTCTMTTSNPVTAENITTDQTLWDGPGSAVRGSVTALSDSLIAVDSPLSLHSTAQPDSKRLLCSRSELPSYVSQSKPNEFVSRKNNACAFRNEGADRDARCLAHCHDEAAARPVLANRSSRTTLAAESSQWFSLWPQSLAPCICQEFKQPAVIDMAFVQARLSSLSSGSDQQLRGTKPLEPFVEMPVPNAADAWRVEPRFRNQARPPLQFTTQFR